MNSTMVSINTPIRIGKASDAGRRRAGPQRRRPLHPAASGGAGGAIFGDHAPPLREGKYTAGQIDTGWTPAIEADFTGWMRENINKLPVAKEQIEEILNRRQR